ncbi:MAG: glycosyltransferase [Clostridia bacterium]|nr:glycosyltransferase [Clostridia bacterium]MBQ8333403.1 glycosyltransferase [Clostridia bacterium]MBQ8369612.1 glycosyltransferase [Clostridia bacterium]MBQ8511491.1 glycosyltransferase [Clostridia bacterium]
MILSVIIPMYNEKTVAEACAKDLTDALEAYAAVHAIDYEVIFSDDGSTDGCGALIEKFAAEHALTHGKVRLVTAEKNAGKGSAVRLGMLASCGDYVCFTDSDLAYGAEIIGEMLTDIREKGGDLLIGSRAIHPDGYAGYTFLRKLASKTFIKVLSMTAGFRGSDSQTGMKFFVGETARKIFANTTVNGWAFDFEVLLIAQKMGKTIREYPVTVLNHRESKVRLLSDSLKMMKDVRRIKDRVKKLELK